MAILSREDFNTGKVKIATDQNTAADFEVYFSDSNLKKYLYPMLGQELADEYISDPTAEKFEPINDFLLIRGFTSEGMKECLKNFVAAEYAANQPHVNGLNGFQQITIEAAKVTITHTLLYNRGVQMAKAIQQQSIEIYDNFKGVYLNYSGI